MIPDRIKENISNLDRGSPVSVFSILRVFPVKVQNFPDVILTFSSIIFGRARYFPYFLCNQGVGEN